MQHHSVERTRRQSARRYRAAAERAWDHLTHAGEVLDCGLREHVASSWQRCLAQGVSPVTQIPPPAASGAALDALREQHGEFMLAAHNTWRLLGDILADTNSLLVVADPRGVILDVAGNPAVVGRACEGHVEAGIDWSEAAGGTNAVGTAIATGQPTEVESVEHYCSVAKIWACAAAPVRDTVDGSLVGVVDITSYAETWHGHSLALAVTAAHQIEQTLQSRDLARNVQLLQWYQSNLPRWSNHALLLLDRKGRIVTSNGHAQSLFRDRQLVERMTRGAPLLEVAAGAVRDTDLEDLPHGLRAHALEAYGRGRDWEGGLLVLDAVRTIAPARPRLPGGTLPAATESSAFRAIVAQSEVMAGIKARAARMAAAAAPVLVLGETGTGKELFARALHAGSPVAAGPFVAVNCGTLTRELAASQLLGYEPGAFTGAAPRGAAGKFEQADGGTLFLDEVAELPPEVQVHLLRVLQDGVVVRVGGQRERQVKVRIVAATNRDLEADVAAGLFRRDLYYRLKVLCLELPPLRARREDIALLAEAAIAELNERYGFGPKRLASELLAHLEQQPWPGNVRELRGVIESMYVMARDDRLTLGDYPQGPVATPVGVVAPTLTLELKSMSSLERDAILAHLAAHGGNRSQVARALGISRSTLYRKLAEYGIA